MENVPSVPNFQFPQLIDSIQHKYIISNSILIQPTTPESGLDTSYPYAFFAPTVTVDAPGEGLPDAMGGGMGVVYGHNVSHVGSCAAQWMQPGQHHSERSRVYVQSQHLYVDSYSTKLRYVALVGLRHKYPCHPAEHYDLDDHHTQWMSFTDTRKSTACDV
jgi:hypothetical protein